MPRQPKNYGAATAYTVTNCLPSFRVNALCKMYTAATIVAAIAVVDTEPHAELEVETKGISLCPIDVY